MAVSTAFNTNYRELLVNNQTTGTTQKQLAQRLGRAACGFVCQTIKNN